MLALYCVSIEYRHFFWQVNSQFNQSCNIAIFIIPWCLVEKLMLAVTDNLIGIAFVSLYHVANHSTSFLSMTIIEIFANHIAITINGTFVLIEYNTFFIAYCCCDVRDVFEIVTSHDLMY